MHDVCREAGMRALRAALLDNLAAGPYQRTEGCEGAGGAGGDVGAGSVKVSAKELREAIAQAHPSLRGLEISHPRKDWQAA